MKTLSQTDLQDLANGACILGSGGGGPLAIATQLIQDILKSGKPAQLVDTSEVSDHDWLGVSAYEGSPDAAVQGAFEFDAAAIAFRTLNAERKNPLRYLLAIEIGAGNSLIPFTVGVRLGLPVIDADGAGRAIPSLTMCTYAAHNLPISPVVLANEALQISLGVKDAATSEIATRALLSQAGFGQDAGLALWAMTGAQMKQSAIRGTVSTALALGTKLRESIQHGMDPVATVIEAVNGRLMFTGTIESFPQTTAGGFDLGQMTLVNQAGKRILVLSQNENLLLWDQSQSAPLMMAPDLIMMMTTDGLVFSNADYATARGKEVAVIGTRARPELRQPALLSVFLNALRAIGYGGPYVSFV